MVKKYIAYINVGNLPPAKVEEYIKKVADLFREGDNPWLKTGERLLLLPVRDEDTHVEVFYDD